MNKHTLIIDGDAGRVELDGIELNDCLQGISYEYKTSGYAFVTLKLFCKTTLHASTSSLEDGNKECCD